MRFQPVTKRGKYIYTGLGLLLWLDMMLFFILYYTLGGSVANGGYEKDGHYFLWHKLSPHFVEVSRETWLLSYYQLCSVGMFMVFFAMAVTVLMRTGDLK